MMQVLGAFVDQSTPEDAWNALSITEGAVLVDVRSRPEWQFCGMPDLSDINREVWAIEWQTWPDMAPNLRFLADIEEQMGHQIPSRVFFMCRAGPRSISAARAFAQQMQARGISLHVTDITEGFEGERNLEGHRARLTGWKAAGLPWRQS